ncbi:Uncharacterised protein [Bordetella pertussis]|nr:Uncharacterised protein [Bordetella pertussis]CFM97477.1 Uncharacterised protein [Bordetella pertussis]CFN97124.1 Uncharacterised protein [Bordetella pertussis]CFP27120.1 Uncharacterised protein [Bordetella pertussis]CFU10534.1 Uncharacterised protein [Bordetella pertussis]
MVEAAPGKRGGVRGGGSARRGGAFGVAALVPCGQPAAVAVGAAGGAPVSAPRRADRGGGRGRRAGRARAAPAAGTGVRGRRAAGGRLARLGRPGAAVVHGVQHGQQGVWRVCGAWLRDAVDFGRRVAGDGGVGPSAGDHGQPYAGRAPPGDDSGFGKRAGRGTGIALRGTRAGSAHHPGGQLRGPYAQHHRGAVADQCRGAESGVRVAQRHDGLGAGRPQGRNAVRAPGPGAGRGDAGVGAAARGGGAAPFRDRRDRRGRIAASARRRRANGLPVRCAHAAGVRARARARRRACPGRPAGAGDRFLCGGAQCAHRPV